MNTFLNDFGLAIGSMDIFGAFCYELAVIWMLHRAYTRNTPILPISSTALLVPGSSPSGAMKMTIRVLWAYLILLNTWIVISALMLLGIIWHKPQLMVFWILWCLVGLVFDIFFLLWWILELITGDIIDSSTNIIMSLLAMAVEFGFVYVIYGIYLNLSPESTRFNFLHFIF